MTTPDEYRLPNQDGAQAHTFDPRNFKADMIVRLGEKLKDIGEGMKSCANDEQFGRMAQAKNEYQKIADKEWLTARNITGKEQARFLSMFEFGIHAVFTAANQTIQVSK